LGILAKARNVLENDGGFQLLEEIETYIGNSAIKMTILGIKMPIMVVLIW
jgi:hypothetical protein